MAKLNPVKKVGLSFLALLITTSSALAEPVSIPANTKIYVTTNQELSGKKKRTREGQVVRASVWRDVTIDGRTVIAAGAPVLVRVDSLKGAKVAGIKGKMSLGAYEATAVDKTPLPLSGGYNKEGKGKVALTATLAAVVFLPLIFMKGKAANIPEGTVFDAYVDRSVTVNVHGARSPRINVSAVIASLSVEVLYDELQATEKPEVFPFLISAPAGVSGDFYVQRVNGVPIDAIRLESKHLDSDSGTETWRGEVSIKRLSKEFKKGVNTFEIATDSDGDRLSTEVVLDLAF